MGKYATEWTATCPKCEKSITPEMIACKTCGKGIIKALPRPYDFGSFGCERCDTKMNEYLRCPDCKTTIPDHFIKVSESALKAEAQRVKKEKRKGIAIGLVGSIGLPILVVSFFIGFIPALVTFVFLALLTLLTLAIVK